MTVTAQSKADREQDILNALWFKRITKDQASKLLTELHEDWLEARAIIRETERSE